MMVELNGKYVSTLAQLRSDRRIRAYRRYSVEDLWMLPEGHRKRVEQGKDFDAADAVYEAEKVALETTLGFLSSEEWEAYCDALGWKAVGETQEEQVSDYVARG
jgi:hypothetical protein